MQMYANSGLRRLEVECEAARTLRAKMNLGRELI